MQFKEDNLKKEKKKLFEILLIYCFSLYELFSDSRTDTPIVCILEEKKKS